MGLERYVVDAVLVEGRSPTAIAQAQGLSRSWLYELISRFHRGGYEALEPVAQYSKGDRGRLPLANSNRGAATRSTELAPALISLPQSTASRRAARQSERLIFRGKKNIRELREAYPTPPTGTLRRIIGLGGSVGPSR